MARIIYGIIRDNKLETSHILIDGKVVQDEGIDINPEDYKVVDFNCLVFGSILTKIEVLREESIEFPGTGIRSQTFPCRRMILSEENSTLKYIPIDCRITT